VTMQILGFLFCPVIVDFSDDILSQSRDYGILAVECQGCDFNSIDVREVLRD